MKSGMSDLSKRVIELNAKCPQRQRDLDQEERRDNEGDVGKDF